MPHLLAAAFSGRRSARRLIRSWQARVARRLTPRTVRCFAALRPAAPRAAGARLIRVMLR
jgi:hypothetical protein